jgi:hypothetical protein
MKGDTQTQTAWWQVANRYLLEGTCYSETPVDFQRGVISHTIKHFTTTAVRTSDPASLRAVSEFLLF